MATLPAVPDARFAWRGKLPPRPEKRISRTSLSLNFASLAYFAVKPPSFLDRRSENDPAGSDSNTPRRSPTRASRGGVNYRRSIISGPREPGGKTYFTYITGRLTLRPWRTLRYNLRFFKTGEMKRDPQGAIATLPAVPDARSAWRGKLPPLDNLRTTRTRRKKYISRTSLSLNFASLAYFAVNPPSFLDRRSENESRWEQLHNQLKLQMQTHAGHPDGSPVAVVTRVQDVLQVGCDEGAAPDVHVVIAFDNVFSSVIQSAISQEETMPAQGQIDLMVPGNAV